MTASAVLPVEARLRRPVENKRPDPRPSRGGLSLSFVLPVRRYICTRLVQVNMLIDMIDPCDRNKVMVLAVGRALLRELDLVRPVEMVDLSHCLSVGRNDVHVFFDLRCVGHGKLQKSELKSNAAGSGKLHSAAEANWGTRNWPVLIAEPKSTQAKIDWGEGGRLV
jgi:hypothetical protein